MLYVAVVMTSVCLENYETSTFNYDGQFNYATIGVRRATAVLRAVGLIGQ